MLYGLIFRLIKTLIRRGQGVAPRTPGMFGR